MNRVHTRLLAAASLSSWASLQFAENELTNGVNFQFITYSILPASTHELLFYLYRVHREGSGQTRLIQHLQYFVPSGTSGLHETR